MIGNREVIFTLVFPNYLSNSESTRKSVDVGGEIELEIHFINTGDSQKIID